MEPLNVKREDLGNLKNKLTITVPAKDVETAYEKVSNQLKPKVKINGFRKGKMPQGLLEKRFSKYMQEEAMETLVPQYYQKAVVQEKLAPAVNPEFSDLQVEKGKPFVFSATFEVWPDFEMPAKSLLALKKEELSLTESEKKARKDGHLGRAAELSPKDGAAATGDQLKLDFTGKTEDEEEVEQKDFIAVLGNGQLIEAFETALVGMKAGESKEFDAQLPADHPEDRFKDKKAHFKVELKEVKTRQLPALDAAFLARYGESIKTEADFDQLIEKELLGIKERERANQYREALRSQLAGHLNFVVPPSLLESEVGFRLHQLTQSPQNKGKEEAELRPLAQKEAEDYLRLNRYIHRYLEDNKITPEDNEVWRRFSMQAGMMGQNPNELLRTDYGRQFYNDVYQSMAEEAVLDHLSKELLT
ncbi:MAG: trigger factor [Candidatus Lambdaproteobacteria bacterium RIFOXYD1_FULL_56_27]|uniref:Trigger factor n=1 Tax=Candidatus Lambdaproteobacteria bacterium RIFOXYD2_FULL_56_26 TaxID=1817773 RepID=A0A1F6GLS2_9PROT|nr:MAG: trigger factor [Candidatus Lambdaproteobacteria bacterium RIFOXYD2_FULL_56_26]OGH01450.1 MAG: trigger factor [Candidatus Lambdaproteobacteria bacterium RIFOXYC1_FULL_56_13]OGH07062.1 MAG: trigger factor [Candidatus Lambdaproteobacteria bacterium RIFOXYD1_FULL_56_27]